MKNLLTILLITLGSLGFSQSLELRGRIEGKKPTIEVWEYSDNFERWVLLEDGKKYRYSVSMFPKGEYKIVFKTENCTKVLYVDRYTQGYMNLDVDLTECKGTEWARMYMTSSGIEVSKIPEPINK